MSEVVRVLGFATVVVLAACGGRALEDGTSLPPSSAPGVAGAASSASGTANGGAANGGAANGGAANGGAGEAGDGASGMSGAASGIGLSCLGSMPVAVCPQLSVDLDFTNGANANPDVEVLQLPDYGTPQFTFPQPDPAPSSAWDRSATPAGACVFRLHGVSSNCLSLANTILIGSCNGEDRPNGILAAPGSYYSGECMDAVLPGCPSSDPWSYGGYWWYVIPRGADTDLVICAPECAQSFAASGHGCFEL